MRYDELYRRLVDRALRTADIDIDTFFEQAVASGMSPETVQQRLIDDLENRGPIFGKFIRSLAGASESSVLEASRQGAFAIDASEELARLTDLSNVENAIESADPEALENIETLAADAVRLTWVAELVNTCEFCLPLHGTARTKTQWEAAGLQPATIHANQGWNSTCHCRLVPEDQAGGRADLIAPLLRTQDKSAQGLRLSRKTVRSVSQKDLDRSVGAVAKARESLDGRRTLRYMGQANAKAGGGTDGES